MHGVRVPMLIHRSRQRNASPNTECYALKIHLTVKLNVVNDKDVNAIVLFAHVIRAQ